MVLLLIDPENSYSTESRLISDYDNVYDDMPDSKADVVVVDANEVTRSVSLRSVRGLIFEHEGTLCPAWMAIESAVVDNPRAIYESILMALEPD